LNFHPFGSILEPCGVPFRDHDEPPLES
jgi:hypothetical protein